MSHAPRTRFIPVLSQVKRVIKKGTFYSDQFCSSPRHMEAKHTHVCRILIYLASHQHTESLYTSTIKYHRNNVSTFTPPVHFHRLTYYHTDVSKMSTARYRCITVTTVTTPGLFSLFILLSPNFSKMSTSRILAPASVYQQAPLWFVFIVNYTITWFSYANRVRYHCVLYHFYIISNYFRLFPSSKTFYRLSYWNADISHMSPTGYHCSVVSTITPPAVSIVFHTAAVTHRIRALPSITSKFYQQSPVRFGPIVYHTIILTAWLEEEHSMSGSL